MRQIFGYVVVKSNSQHPLLLCAATNGMGWDLINSDDEAAFMFISCDIECDLHSIKMFPCSPSCDWSLLVSCLCSGLQPDTNRAVMAAIDLCQLVSGSDRPTQ